MWRPGTLVSIKQGHRANVEACRSYNDLLMNWFFTAKLDHDPPVVLVVIAAWETNVRSRSYKNGNHACTWSAVAMGEGRVWHLHNVNTYLDSFTVHHLARV